MREINISDFTITELEEEIKRKQKKEAMPSPLHTINWTRILNVTEDRMTTIAEGFGSRNEEDVKQFLYEEVMKTIYGADVFEWINKNTE